MIKERLLRVNTHTDSICRLDGDEVKRLRLKLFKFLSEDSDSLELNIVVNDNELFLTHPGGILGSYMTNLKNLLLAQLLLSLANKPVCFKRSKLHGNYIYVP